MALCICGYVAETKISDEVLGRMRDTMIHRGPNDAGIYGNGTAGYAIADVIDNLNAVNTDKRITY